jgi:hypothetical protein
MILNSERSVADLRNRVCAAQQLCGLLALISMFVAGEDSELPNVPHTQGCRRDRYGERDGCVREVCRCIIPIRLGVEIVLLFDAYH